MKIELTNPKASNSEIANLESQTGLSIPQEIKELYKTGNGGHLSRTIIKTEDGIIGLRKVFSTKERPNERELIKKVLKTWDRNGEYLLPLGYDDGGNTIVIDTKSGKTYILNHDTANTPLELITQDLPTFFQAIQKEEEGPKKN